jgi:hypothetical protein
MKKLFALLFAAGLTLSLAMPVFARGASSQDTASTEKTKKTKKSKTKKQKTSDTSKMSQ